MKNHKRHITMRQTAFREPKLTKGLKDHLSPFLGTCFVAGFILTILAPYGTHTMTLLPRAAFWIGLCVAGGLGAASVSLFCRLRNLTLSPIATTLWQSLGSTVLVSLCLVVLNYGLTGQFSLQGILLVVFYVWVIAVTLSAIGNLIGHRSSTLETTPTRAALYERLRPNLRSADIFALSAEDHYVRVHTSNGDDLILMRLSDAIREMEPHRGLSPHRSWWVAENGVQSVTKKDGKTWIKLHSRIDVPVSRSRHKDLKEAGWI